MLENIHLLNATDTYAYHFSLTSNCFRQDFNTWLFIGRYSLINPMQNLAANLIQDFFLYFLDHKQLKRKLPNKLYLSNVIIATNS